MNQDFQKYSKEEPRLEDFGLDVSVYENRDVKSKEEWLIEEKIVSLEKAKEKNEKNISRIDGVIAVWFVSFVYSLFFALPAVILNNFIEEYINLDLFIFIWISFILIFGWVWGFFEDVLDKIRKKKQEIEKHVYLSDEEAEGQ